MNERKTAHGTLLSADESALVVIDCASRADGAPADAAAVGTQFGPPDMLMQAASELQVPVLATIHKGVLGDKDAGLLHLDARRGPTILREEINPWENAEFVQAVKDTKRHRLVVAGQCTEISVTFAVLSALAEGYDVFLVQDAALGASQVDVSIAVARMVQAGAVPVIARQIVMEWRRGEKRPADVGAPISPSSKDQ